MTLSWPQKRIARLGAASALILTCALASLAVAQPQSSSGDSATASTAAKKTATKSTTAAHKTSAHSSATQSSPAKKSTTKIHTASTTTHASSKGSTSKSRKKTVRARGQQKIDSERAEQIQTALIREHYLTGEPTGTWNADSEDAMRRYQGDHGWQTKEVPDARALIKLGLGPSNDHLLNPESAMTSSPDAPKASYLPTSSHSAPAASDPVSPSSSTSSDSPIATPSAGTSSPSSTATPTSNDPQQQ
jgi:hypothetical protein